MKKSKNSGFTLIELIIAIAIIGIVGSVAIPRVVNLVQRSKLSSYEYSAKILINAIERALVDGEIVMNEGNIDRGIYQSRNDINKYPLAIKKEDGTYIPQNSVLSIARTLVPRYISSVPILEKDSTYISSGFMIDYNEEHGIGLYLIGYDEEKNILKYYFYPRKKTSLIKASN